MSQPVAYTPTTDFSTQEAASAGGRSTVDTNKLDAEFTALQATISQVRTVIALNQRDDGEIRDGRVKIHTLAVDILAIITAAGANVRGAWLTATAYIVKDVVVQAASTYICAVAHTSGVFATDLTAVKWVLIANAPSAFSAGAVSFTPTGGIAASNVQAAIAELDVEALKVASNLSDVAIPATALINLGGLALAGGTMTGAIVLAGNPDTALKAAPKQYVDDVIDGLNAGQCYFNVTSTTTATLTTLNGNRLFINGAWLTIPSIGVSVSNAGLSISTTYYAYGFSNAGTLTLELSTTAYAVDTTYGNNIKNGDATRVLVGVARTQSGSAIFETAVSLFLSWFNRKLKRHGAAFTVDRPTGSTSAVELSSEIRTPFLCWTGDAVRFFATGFASNSINATTRSYIGIDGTAARSNGSLMQNSDAVPISHNETTNSIAEGYHYATLIGNVSAGTGTWSGVATYGCRITVEVMG